VQQSYASSVEMVTSPEEWPVWRTRKPVIIALRHHHGRVEQHRYRYMVVTPGAHGCAHGYGNHHQEVDININMDGSEHSAAGAGLGLGSGDRMGTGVATSQDDSNFATEVMMWEDPFQDRQVSVVISVGSYHVQSLTAV